MPLTKAAKRAEVFCAVPITVAAPVRTPDCSMNFLEIGPLSAREPANAKPNPSRMDFLPSSTTSSGMSSYLLCCTKVPTYFVIPGLLGNSSASAVASAGSELASTDAPITPREVFPKSRRRIVHRKPQLTTAGLHRRAPPLPCLRGVEQQGSIDAIRKQGFQSWRETLRAFC